MSDASRASERDNDRLKRENGRLIAEVERLTNANREMERRQGKRRETAVDGGDEPPVLPTRNPPPQRVSHRREEVRGCRTGLAKEGEEVMEPSLRAVPCGPPAACDSSMNVRPALAASPVRNMLQLEELADAAMGMGNHFGPAGEEVDHGGM